MALRTKLITIGVVAAAAATTAGLAFADSGSGGKGECAPPKSQGSVVQYIAKGDDCGAVGKQPGEYGTTVTIAPGPVSDR